MAKIDYAMDGNIAVVTLNSGENRFNPEFINAFLGVLDSVEKTEAIALVVKSGHEKIFSNGIDLEWLIPVIQRNDIDTAKQFFYSLNKLFKATLLYPMITVAAISGHAFAGGALWSCAFDFRFMRSDRGFFCFPEIDLGIPFLPGMMKLMKKVMPMCQVEEMMFSGNRITAEVCEKNRIITKACHINTLLQDAVTFAKSFNKKPAVVKEMKLRLYNDIVHALDVEDVPYIESGKFHIG